MTAQYALIVKDKLIIGNHGRIKCRVSFKKFEKAFEMARDHCDLQMRALGWAVLDNEFEKHLKRLERRRLNYKKKKHGL